MQQVLNMHMLSRVQCPKVTTNLGHTLSKSLLMMQDIATWHSLDTMTPDTDTMNHGC